MSARRAISGFLLARGARAYASVWAVALFVVAAAPREVMAQGITEIIGFNGLHDPAGVAANESGPPTCNILLPPGAAAGVYAPNTWPDGLVYYAFHANVTPENQQKALAAMAEIEAVSFVQFIERTDEPNYVLIQQTPSGGCSAQLGMVGGQQNLFLAPRCLNYKFSIVHELMHALAIRHEQTRSDRDQYVEINFDNIQPVGEHNFAIMPGTTDDGPYDFDSVMHYGRNAWGIDGDWTISVLHPYKRVWQRAIRQRDYLSHGDIWVLYHLYGGNPPPGAFELSAPARGALVGEAWTPTFSWSASELVDSYRLLVDDDGGFASPEIDATLSQTSYVHAMMLAPNRFYHWTVIATNVNGQTEPYPFRRGSFYTDSAVPQVLYVDDDAAPGGSGASWADSMRHPGDAPALAEAAGGVTEIRVAQGLYTPDYGTGDRKMSFPLVSGVALLGGYAGINEPDPDVRDPDVYVSTFSGDLTGDDLPDFVNNEENSYAVIFAVDVDQTAVVDGFLISAGNADSIQFGYSAGAGMMNDEGSPVIRNCVFTGGFGFGGGVSNCFHGSPTFNGCLFANNRGPLGGGLLNFHVDNAAIINCRFTANTAFEFGGGGVDNIGSSSAFINCIFTENTAPFGGGMRNLGNSSPLVINCTFSDNSASASTGGAIISSSTSVAIVANSVLWANLPGEITGAATVRYSNVQGGFTGTGNIDADPLFADPLNGDYHLLPGSPSIDAGDNTTVPLGVTTDLDGNPRFIDIFAVADTGNGTPPIVDMGVYEHVTDCNGNGIGDEQDIAGGTSLDCNSNGIPDECEPNEDCQPNGTPDICDIGTGTSQDCTSNGIPDECEPDCNGNTVADSCDIAGGTSTDCNFDGIPDECGFAPEPERLETLPGQPISTKNRFLSFSAVDVGRSQAVRVTFLTLPVPFDVWNGATLWAGAPVEVSENSGTVNPADAPGAPTFNAARLQCAGPVFLDWNALGVVHLFHEGIVPGGEYLIQVINDFPCSPDVESSFSAPLEITQAKWGDIVENCATFPCPPPDGINNILDVLANVDKFVNAATAIIKARGELVNTDANIGGCVNLKVDIIEVLRTVDALLTLPYPFTPSTPLDPCASTCPNPLP